MSRPTRSRKKVDYSQLASEGVDDDGHYLVVLTQVSRHRIHADGTMADNHDTSARIVTRIEKLELSFPTLPLKQEVMKSIFTFLDEVEREEQARRESAINEEIATGVASEVKKQRSWAKKRGTLTKSKQNLLKHDDEDDMPKKRTSRKKPVKKAAAKPKKKKEEEEEEEDADDETKGDDEKPAKKGKEDEGEKQEEKEEADEEDDDDEE